jgi:hypothetical protein
MDKMDDVSCAETPQDDKKNQLIGAHNTWQKA